MKDRKSWVSNSSSTSFCVYGICIDEAEFMEVVKNKYPNCKIGETNDEGDEWNYWDWIESEDLDTKGLTFEHCGEAETHWIGLSATEIEDEETGKQFKERAEKALNEFFGDHGNDLRWYVDEYYS